MTFRLLDPALFWRKLVALVTATVLLAPLLYYRWEVPAALFAGGLLVLHAAFLYLYFWRVPWRRLLKHKAELMVRLMGVGFFVYLLSLITVGGSPGVAIFKLCLATVVHAAVLTAMMLVRVEEGEQYGRI
ncbi:MAG TPA: hypothetical protein VLF91_03955 [Candidatus Saccharimonadales bacterium]|nr:hypothetical protein [Candidatus Saccharimonadales bacterium]